MEIYRPEKFKSSAYLPEVQAVLAAVIERDKNNPEAKNFLPNSLKIISDLSDKKDTLRHSQRMTNLGYLLAKKLNFSKEEVEFFVEACLLHDVGKKDIAWKHRARLSEKFSKVDRREMKKHPKYSYQYLRWAGRSPRVYYPVYLHHAFQEDPYPETKADFLKSLDGLEDKDVDNARLLAMLDVFDIMAFGRPYVRISPIPLEDARQKLAELFGEAGDGEMIEFLVGQYERIRELG